MPTYEVLKPGFHGGELYSPRGKRRTLTTEVAFKKTPSWLRLVEKGAKRKPAAKPKTKVEADVKAEIDEANFLGEGETSPTVQTL